MRSVDFHGLSRSAQDHFVDATKEAQPPAPLLVSWGGPRRHRFGWLVALVSFVGLGVLIASGFGDLGSDAVVHGLPVAGAYVVLFALGVGGALHAMAREQETGALPWKAGVYLFPSSLIDARTHVLRVFPVDELTRFDAGGATAKAIYPGGTFTFSGSADAIGRARDAIADVQSSGPVSEKARASVDPLAEPRYSNPLGPQGALQRTVPGWAHGRIALALAAAAVAGPTLWFGRNLVSDDRMFDDAKKRDEVGAYRAYLRHGVRHRNDVASVLLPRAELALAKKDGTVDAILAYGKAHPTSGIQSEVDAALRTAMLAELEVAKKEGTLAALRAFAKKRPDHGLAPEIKVATHAVYAAALESFKTDANLKDPTVVPFVERLLAWAEAKDNPKVEVRFHTKPSGNMVRADKYVTKQATFNGETSYPAKYFETARLQPHEKQLAKSLVERLSAAFKPEILTFTVGAPVETETPPAFTVPTLFVVHHVEWTGTAYNSNRPRGIFIGAQYMFHSSFVVPDGKKPLETKMTLPRPVSLTVLKDFAKAAPAPGDVEKAVYDEMSKEGFEQFAAKWIASVFKTKH